MIDFLFAFLLDKNLSNRGLSIKEEFSELTGGKNENGRLVYTSKWDLKLKNLICPPPPPPPHTHRRSEKSCFPKRIFSSLEIIIVLGVYSGESCDILHLYSDKTDKKIVIISVILNEFSYSKVQIPHPFL